MQKHRSNNQRSSSSKSSTVVLFNKPFNTLCQFTAESGDSTLADYIDIKNVYPAGRLDKDSEGLLLLTDDGKLQHHISHPTHKLAKTYWVQVEGMIDKEAIMNLSKGINLKDGRTKTAQAKQLDMDKIDFNLWDRNPPVRFRKNIPTSWLELKIKEGKNRQVRRMTAAVGFPTLRLIRVAIGQWQLGNLQPGEYRQLKI